jgi:redox-sensitive bicupin YhaK (pirin superfamily)
VTTATPRVVHTPTPKILSGGVYSGQPIGQPVAMGGLFVMNTKAEITQAFNDFHTGKFGHIPR